MWLHMILELRCVCVGKKHLCLLLLLAGCVHVGFMVRVWFVDFFKECWC